MVTRLTRSALAPLAVAAVLMAALTGCTDDPSSAQERPASAAAATATESASQSPTSDTQVRPGQPGTALAALEALPVKGRAPMTGYDRDQFGKVPGAEVTDGAHVSGEPFFELDRHGIDLQVDKQIAGLGMTSTQAKFLSRRKAK